MLPTVMPRRVNCASIFRGINTEIERAKHMQQNKLTTDKQFVQLANDCETFIRRRGYLTVPVNTEEEEYPLAFSIQVCVNIIGATLLHLVRQSVRIVILAEIETAKN